MNRSFALPTALSARYLDRLLASPRGRTFVYRQAAAAEADDEGRFFTELLTKVDDPELAKLIRIHQADEERHAQLFAAAADRVGEVVPLPQPEQMIIQRLDRELGGFFARFAGDGAGVAEAYALLQVLEERAVTEFELLLVPLRRHDPAGAGMLEEIRTDEVRHLKYCRAVGRRYAEDETSYLATVARFRAIEATAFVAHQRDNMRFTLEHELAALGPVERRLWQGLAWLGERRPARPMPTRFADQAA